MHAYNDEYYDDGGGVNGVEKKKERKKKKHHKREEEEIPTEQLHSEEENQDPHVLKKHRSHRRRENENGEVEIEENDEERRRRRREKKRLKKQLEKEAAEEALKNETGNNYPFEDDNYFFQEQHEPHEEWQDDIDPNEDAYHPDPSYQEENSFQPVEEEIPPQPVEKTKKTGGFGKIFASFKRKSKRKNSTQESDQQSNRSSSGRDNEAGWQSNPDLFNPAFDDTQPNNTLTKKKTRSTRAIPNVTANVVLLDGEEVSVEVDKKSLGQQLFDTICNSLDLLEKDFFGLTFVRIKLKTWFWLELDKKISKQLAKEDEWTFNFQVKFYPPEPVLLQEDVTRYLLCLQVRQDVYSGKLPCSWVTQALLGSLLVQSELGDYDPEEHDHDDIGYLREFEFVRDQTDQLLEKIADMHHKHAGMQPDKADLKYLETAKRLELYGVDLHPARDNDDVEIYIGVCYQGVLIYRDRMRIGRFAWPKVLRISYKKNYFYLKIRSDRYENSVAIVGFKMYDHNLAKRLWKNAVEQHTFFRMKEPMNGRRSNTGLSGLLTITKSSRDNSGYLYSGKTMHQYRSMNLARTTPAHFDRSLNKRRTIGSMPAGLDRAGLQYRSMHSLNRAHPRDMTLNKTKSVEYLSGKPPTQSGSVIGIQSIERDDVFSRTSGSERRSNIQQQIELKPRLSTYSRDMSYRSGDSINAAESYTVRDDDDRASLPPTRPLQIITGAPKKAPLPRTNRQTKPPPQVVHHDLSDDSISNNTPEPIKRLGNSPGQRSAASSGSPSPHNSSILLPHQLPPPPPEDELMPSISTTNPLMDLHSRQPPPPPLISTIPTTTKPKPPPVKPKPKIAAKPTRQNFQEPVVNLNLNYSTSATRNSRPVPLSHQQRRYQDNSQQDDISSNDDML